MTLETDRPDIIDWLNEDLARRRALGHCARMSQNFEAHNAAQIRRDRARGAVRLAKNVIAALVIVFVAALVMSPQTVDNIANPAQIEQ